MRKQITLEELELTFDRVLLKHEKGENGFGGYSQANLILGDDVYCGIAHCHVEDQFNKVKGRQIAFGRALHAYNVAVNGKPTRSVGLATALLTSYVGKLVPVEGQKLPNIVFVKDC